MPHLGLKSINLPLWLDRFSISLTGGDRTRRTWLTRLPTSQICLRDLLGGGLLPVLELWHFRGQTEAWADIETSLRELSKL